MSQFDGWTDATNVMVIRLDLLYGFHGYTYVTLRRLERLIRLILLYTDVMVRLDE